VSVIQVCPQTGRACEVSGCAGCLRYQQWGGPTYGRYGWICPRCQAVHSPDVQTCHCNGLTPTLGGPGSASNVG